MARWWWRKEDYLVNDEVWPEHASAADGTPVAIATPTTPRSYVKTLGDGVSSYFEVGHGLNNEHVICSLRVNYEGYPCVHDILDYSLGQVRILDANHVAVSCGSAPAQDGITLVVVG